MDVRRDRGLRMDGVADDLDGERPVLLQRPHQPLQRQPRGLLQDMTGGHRRHHDRQVRIDGILLPVGDRPGLAI